MNLMNLLPRDYNSQDIGYNISLFENIIGKKLPITFRDFIGSLGKEEISIVQNLTCKLYNFSPEGDIIVEDEHYFEYVSYSFYMLNNKKHYEAVRFFMNVEKNLYMIKGDFNPEIKEVMLSNEIVFIADIYDTKFWCIGFGEHNFGQVFFIDTWESTLYHAFNTFEEFTNSIFIGVHVPAIPTSTLK